MKNLTYLLPFVLYTAVPHTQHLNTSSNGTPVVDKVEEIIKHKTDSVMIIADSLRYDVQEIKIQQDKINKLRLLEKKLDKELQQIKDENQYKRITKEFDF